MRTPRPASPGSRRDAPKWSRGKGKKAKKGSPATGPLGLSRGELFTTTAPGAGFCFMACSISTSFSLSAPWEAEVLAEPLLSGASSRPPAGRGGTPKAGGEGILTPAGRGARALPFLLSALMCVRLKMVRKRFFSSKLGLLFISSGL